MLLLVDGSNLLHRVLRTEQFHLVNSKGFRTGGLYGILRSIHKQCRESRFTCLPIICWDEGAIKFRQDIYPGYKDHKKTGARDEVPVDPTVEQEEAEFFQSLFVSKQILHSSLLPLLSIPSIMVPGVEADDILAFLCRNIKERSIILSNDADLFQLISDNVKVYKPVTETLYDKERLISEYRLLPEHYKRHFILVKAMVAGEDGIPHVLKGLGVKGAAKIAAKLILMDPLDSRKKNELEIAKLMPDVHRNIKLMDLDYFQDNAISEVTAIKQGLSQAILNSASDEFQAYSKLDELELNEAKNYVSDLAQTGWVVRSRIRELIINNVLK